MKTQEDLILQCIKKNIDSDIELILNDKTVAHPNEDSAVEFDEMGLLNNIIYYYCPLNIKFSILTH